VSRGHKGKGRAAHQEVEYSGESGVRQVDSLKEAVFSQAASRSVGEGRTYFMTVDTFPTASVIPSDREDPADLSVCGQVSGDYGIVAMSLPVARCSDKAMGCGLARLCGCQERRKRRFVGPR